MAKNRALFAEYEPKNCKDVFSVINTRQITALMFHDEMADLFDFLGLRGFKRMHEYQYLAESAEHRTLKRYYLNHHGMLLPDEEIEPVDVIPDDWYQYNRMDVTPAVRKQAVQKAMEQYKEWECGTKELYEKCAAYLMAWQKIADFDKVNELVKDVDMELKHLERLCIELKSVEYSADYIAGLQGSYHEKYKEKSKDIGAIVC